MTASSIGTPYAERIAHFTAQAERCGARSRLVSNLRGLSFGVLAVGGIGALVGDGLGWSITAILGLLVFVVLVVWHGRVLREEEMALRWLQVNREAQQRSGGDFKKLQPDGAEFGNPLHPYAGDLDLFGPASLFQRMNVARTEFGRRRLASFLMNRAEPAEVHARQAAARELAPELELRQRLEALALQVVDPLPEAEGETAARRRSSKVDTDPLLAWAESEPVFLNTPSLLWVSRLMPPLTLTWLGYCWVQGLHAVAWVPLLIVQAIVLMSAQRHAAFVFSAVSSQQGVFLRFGPMLELLEQLEPESERLKELKQSVCSSRGHRPSQAMRRFEKIVAWFEFRHNGLVYPLFNVLLFWDVHCVAALERWQREFGRSLRDWFQTLGELEALNSIASFSYDNPGYRWPEVVPGPRTSARFEARGLGHPLITRGCVINDVSLQGPGRALLVTGSNMSGKSTLLRAIGINAVLAQMGAPVCAESLEMGPLTVRTSMRISDSLEQGVSHFYAEVHKLKAVLEATEGDVPVLFLLDEILHGTNSRERQIGARWVLGTLLARGAMGAVSTHDSGLCELPAPLMNQVRQVHLRETEEGGQMTFDYKLREGPVRSGNALRLMRSVGIEVPLEG